jgi:hypothetical protein
MRRNAVVHHALAAALRTQLRAHLPPLQTTYQNTNHTGKRCQSAPIHLAPEGSLPVAVGVGTFGSFGSESDASVQTAQVFGLNAVEEDPQWHATCRDAWQNVTIKLWGKNAGLGLCAPGQMLLTSANILQGWPTPGAAG